MKIIRSGKEAYVAECERCGCVFSFGKEEVNYEGLQWDENKYLICPECGGKIILPYSRCNWMTRWEWEDGQN